MALSAPARRAARTSADESYPALRHLNAAKQKESLMKTVRGSIYGVAIEFAAILLGSIVFVALTLLPWWLACVLALLVIGVVYGLVRQQRARERRRLELLERQAEINRAHIRAERIRREALHYHGAGMR